MKHPGLRPALPAALLAALLACVSGPEPPIDHGGHEDVRRIVAALDDVVGEYHLSVDDSGHVVDAVRLRVLGTLMHDAEVYARRFPPAERAALHDLSSAIEARAAPAGVAARASSLRRQTLSRRRLVLAPGAPPPRARAEEMWRSQCAGCHGLTGVGDGVQGLYLEPEPKNFHDAEVMAALAPSRAFSRIVDGMRGTAMPAWGFLSAAERWGLAFLVLSFQHDEVTVARGRVLAERHRVVVSPTWLADRSDPDLLRDLERRGLDTSAAADVIAYARAEAAFAPTEGVLADVRSALADGVVSYRARSFDEARAHLLLARRRLAPNLDRIRLGAPATAAALELRMQRVTAAARRGSIAEIVEREVAATHVQLDQAELSLRQPSRSGTARLALERAGAAVLALGLLLSRRRRPAELVGAGVAAGAILGVVVAGSLAIGVLGLGLALVVATAHLAPRRVALTLALALLAGLGAGELGSSLPATDATAAVAVLAFTGLVGAALGRVMPDAADRVASLLVVVAALMAATAAAGRGAWLVEASAGDVRWLSVPRVEAVGLYPSLFALAAAGAALALGAGAAIAALTRGHPASLR